MIQRLQEVLSLIHQNILTYYPRKSFIWLTEWLAYLLAILFFLFAFFTYDLLSSFLELPAKADVKIFNGEWESKYFQLKLILIGLHILISLIFYFFARHFRAHRKFRINVKIAERKLDAIIEEHNKVMNEID